ncbi:3-methyl-2-oxobutanoate hydroxymethyltransferase [Ahniella affigens]|uniref:3-methyl-2-oxobutanoate hydroxymethyltransferase n=1 Tax=Ahniella affigens TaxID=2021234 RepID=A0A2P1PPV3_9GAMM|nr:3-methyl-2-oxobutanoate hydroxymethyltransferase [Ahniella affigens]AVP96873.1 3-methyl-2-oxobutanoate hydroxymethyltransferase [Ahniella affigens]
MYAEPREVRATPLTVPDLMRMRVERQPIAALTAYEASTAALMDLAGVDVILIGDSLGMVVQGHRSTLPVTVEHILYHAEAVARGSQRAVRIADMPFGSCPDPQTAYRNAARLIAEGNTAMVKIEGAGVMLPVIEYLVARDIPVCGHVGLTPQSVLKTGGYKLQGRTDEAAEQVLANARAVQNAGAALMVLECVPAGLGKLVTEALSVPVIGIGAGVDCDGQILVLHDILGIATRRRPKFVRNFLDGSGSIQGAIRTYVDAVRSRQFPDSEHSY